MWNIKEIDAGELHQWLESGGDAVRLIDVRTPAEVAQGSIPGAEFIPLHLIPIKMTELKGDKKVVIYCRSGARSAQACAFLSAQGIDNTFNLRGGIIAWVQGGRAVA